MQWIMDCLRMGLRYMESIFGGLFFIFDSNVMHIMTLELRDRAPCLECYLELHN